MYDIQYALPRPRPGRGAGEPLAPEQPEMIKILISADDSLLSAGITQLLAATPDLRLSKTTNNRRLLARVTEERFDLVLSILNGQLSEGVELIADLRAINARLPILALAVDNSPHLALDCIKAGATGFLTNSNNAGELLAAVRRCAEGGHYIAHEVASDILFRPDSLDVELPHRRLSPRELEVLHHLALGLSVVEIAELLHISPKTVSTHKCRLMSKMKMKSYNELVRYAIKYGL